jgi:hypothetical protein
VHQKFASLIERLHPSFEKLLSCDAHTGAIRLPSTVPKRAIYLFSERGKHLYVGRTNRLRSRHKEHWSGNGNDAPFAFKLARYASGNLKTKGGKTRKSLEYKDAEFMDAFRQAKLRISEMEFRWVEEVDPNRQYLLEIYAAISLDAEFNDFENH